MPRIAPDPDAALRFLADPGPAEAQLRRALATSTRAREAAWQLAESAGKTLGLDDVVVYLHATDPEGLQQTAAWGVKQVATRMFENPIVLPIGRGIVGACARDRVPILICDTQLDARYVVDANPRRSELAVPLLGDAGLIGVLDSEHPEPDFYRSIHIRGLLRLAAVFALWFKARPAGV